MGLWGGIKKVGRGIGRGAKKVVRGVKKLGNSMDPTNNEYTAVDPSGGLSGTAGAAGQFAGVGQEGFGRYNQGLDALNAQLRGQTMGQNLVSTEQLRQGLQQNVAAQQSMAASAAPQNQAMAQRTAMIQGARAASGMSGQAALAALQERDLAQRLLAQNQQQQMDANLRAALESRRTEGQAYGNIEDARTRRFEAMSKQPTDLQRGMKAVSGGVKAIGKVASFFSDRNLKKDIHGADEDVQEFMDGLKAYRYEYKNKRHGKGKKLGVMAQDLERSKVGKKTVRKLPEGKAVDVADLTSALAAGTANLNKRLSRLEAKRAR